MRSSERKGTLELGNLEFRVRIRVLILYILAICLGFLLVSTISEIVVKLGILMFCIRY